MAEYVLQHGSMTRPGRWQLHRIQGQKFALFTCPECSRISRVGDLSRIDADGRLTTAYECWNCDWADALRFGDWHDSP